MTENALLIRADASTRIGTGHLTRCLALAQTWEDSGGEVVFITVCESAGLLQRLSDEGFRIVALERSYPDPADWEVTSQVLATHPNAWVVLDGYYFDSTYQRQVKEAGHPLLVIDDIAHLEHYYADIVLNQNIRADELHYECELSTHLLLGTQYVLLRREFLQWKGWKREIPDVARKVLITLGGSDPDNITLKIISAMNKLKLKDLEIKVVIGPSNPHMPLLKEAVEHSPLPISLLPSPEDMPELMAWADVAVSGAGSTCWEMAFMELPSALLVLADNQKSIAKGLTEAGAALNLGWFENVTGSQVTNRLVRLLNDRQSRSQMRHLGRTLVDGAGNQRVATTLLETNTNLARYLKERNANPTSCQ